MLDDTTDARFADAKERLDSEVLGGEPITIPMPRAIAWARAHQADDARTFAPDDLEKRVLRALAR